MSEYLLARDLRPGMIVERRRGDHVYLLTITEVRWLRHTRLWLVRLDIPDALRNDIAPTFRVESRNRVRIENIPTLGGRS
jgi:hypothetical protein